MKARKNKSAKYKRTRRGKNAHPGEKEAAARIDRIQTALTRVITAMVACISMYTVSPSDFIRTSQGAITNLITLLLSMGAENMPGEIGKIWGTSGKTPSASTILAQRKKLMLSFFIDLFHKVTERLEKICPPVLMNGFRVLIVDGFDLAMPKKSFDTCKPIKRAKGKKYEGACTLVHGDAFIDASSRRIQDVHFCPKDESDERAAAIRMMKESLISKAILIMDRGYESYQMMAECIEKRWKFLIRAKDISSNGISSGFRLPDTPEFDVTINLTLLSRKIKEVSELIRSSPNEYKYINWQRFSFFPANPVKNGDKEVHKYRMTFRIVRVCIGEGKYEVLLTDLPSDKFPIEKLKELYNIRWRIEISFRRLKYLGDMVRIHSVKLDYIMQELYCRVTTYNVMMSVAGSIVFQDDPLLKHEKIVNCASAYRTTRYLIKHKATAEDAANYLYSNPTFKINGRVFQRRNSTRNACPFNARSAG